MKYRTLEQVRKAIADNDAVRLDASLAEDVRADLEKTALALRNIERELLGDTSGDIVERLKAAAAPVDRIAADVRAKVTAMNGPAKVLVHMKKVVSVIVQVLTEAGRWR